MPRRILLPPATCIYCGRGVSRTKRGEHIVPAAIGGSCTIKESSGREVCAKCNNEILSGLDQELCSRSFLSVMASQEIDGYLPQVWDVDYSSGKLLTEAYPEWQDGRLLGLVNFPQIIFDSSNTGIRGDFRSAQKLGADNIARVLVSAAKRAFNRYETREKRKSLWFEKIDSDVDTQGYRYPPRVFSPCTTSYLLQDIENRTLVLRYRTQEEKYHALNGLSKLSESREFKSWDRVPCSRISQICHYFDTGMVVRALLKIAFNILAAYCKSTNVARDTFNDVVGTILGETPIVRSQLVQNGFLVHQGIESSRAEVGTHYFRLTGLHGHWHAFQSFFGGRINAKVEFPEPNCEDWTTLEVTAPISSRDWVVRTGRILRPVSGQVAWGPIQALCPSIGAFNSESRLFVEH